MARAAELSNLSLSIEIVIDPLQDTLFLVFTFKRVLIHFSVATLHSLGQLSNSTTHGSCGHMGRPSKTRTTCSTLPPKYSVYINQPLAPELLRHSCTHVLYGASMCRDRDNVPCITSSTQRSADW